MHTVKTQPGLTLVRCSGELGLPELARVAAACARARAEGQRVVMDLARVTHLHYAGARLLREVPGVRLAGATRYVRDLVHAGGGAGYLELHERLEDALGAA